MWSVFLLFLLSCIGATTAEHPFEEVAVTRHLQEEWLPVDSLVHGDSNITSSGMYELKIQDRGATRFFLDENFKMIGCHGIILKSDVVEWFYTFDIQVISAVWLTEEDIQVDAIVNFALAIPFYPQFIISVKKNTFKAGIIRQCQHDSIP